MFLAPRKSQCQLRVESAERCRTRGSSHLPGREVPAQTATGERDMPLCVCSRMRKFTRLNGVFVLSACVGMLAVCWISPRENVMCWKTPTWPSVVMSSPVLMPASITSGSKTPGCRLLKTSLPSCQQAMLILRFALLSFCPICAPQLCNNRACVVSWLEVVKAVM